ncbi:penicillin acylase family protein [Novosphingobium sp.]|uniref:penicillin acylase family protein n=1 Tax=Novosphingobium sp. TaxID=1874826 RepID=UPI0025F04099|nr:penicillin acylase family protein [Novosphingobium sp.]
MTRKWIARGGWTLLALFMIAFVALASWEPFFAERPGAPPPAQTYRADITRDEYGVPHIHGATDPDVAFGVAYAHAQDDFATLQDVVAMTRGRYGAIAGQSGAAVDFAYHFLGARRTAQSHYAQLPADVRAMLDGYASGLNRYAAQHANEIKLSRLFPVNGQDIAAGFALRQPFFFGLDRVLGPLAKEEPLLPEHGPPLNGKPLPNLARGGGDQLVPSAPMPLPMGETAENSGSNAFAVTSSRAGDGVTRLISNSHQPYRGGVAWYELVIDSDSGWHFAGATFPGSPYPFMGHNDNLGWTNTVNRADLIDVYALELDPGGTRFRMDGQWHRLESQRVWLPVRFGPLVLPIPRTVWRASGIGPVMKTARGTFAVRYAGIDSIGSVEQYYRITQAKSFAEWRKAMALQGVPATNFIYADKAGTIAYWYNALIPQRRAGPDWRSPVPLTMRADVWNSYVPWEALPHRINPASGFLFNSNNTPLLAAGPGSEIDPASVPAIWGVETDMTNRARRAVKLLSEAGPITRDRLLRIKFDTGYERAGYVAAMLDGIAGLKLGDNPQLAKAQTLLSQWDMTADGKGRADALAVMVLEQAMKNSYGLRAAPDPKTELVKAVDHLIRYFGRIDPPLGDVVRIRQGGVNLPNDGGGDTLRASTTWDVGKDGRLAVNHGDSFVMVMEWGRDGQVRSESIQPFGQAATRPASPHYADQAALFVAHRFKPVHFNRADAAAHAVSRIVVGN